MITNSHFAATLVLPGTSPSHDANSRLLCSEFHGRMKRVNSKCSSIQQRVNSAIFFASFASGVNAPLQVLNDVRVIND